MNIKIVILDKTFSVNPDTHCCLFKSKRPGKAEGDVEINPARISFQSKRQKKKLH